MDNLQRRRSNHQPPRVAFTQVVEQIVERRAGAARHTVARDAAQPLVGDQTARRIVIRSGRHPVADMNRQALVRVVSESVQVDHVVLGRHRHILFF